MKVGKMAGKVLICDDDAAICKKVAEIELVAAREYPTRAELKGYFDKLEQNLHNFDQKLERLSDRLIK